MRFYMGMVQVVGGGAVLADSADDIDWEPEATLEERTGISSKIKPLAVEPISDRGWQAIAAFQYDGYVREVSLHLSRFGVLEFFNGNAVSDQLPLYGQVFDHGIRELRTLGAINKQIWAPQVAQLEQKLKANPNDETALGQLPGMYINSWRWTDAVEAQKKWLAFVQSEPKHDAAWSSQLQNAYGMLGLYQLYSRDFAGSLASNDEARKLDPNDLRSELYHANALLFLGRASEAEAIYLRHRGEIVVPNNGETWERMIFADFDKFQQVGIISQELAPEVAHIRDLLKPPSN
jgi:tetratricopeptide (TPR) repeat protein